MRLFVVSSISPIHHTAMKKNLLLVLALSVGILTGCKKTNSTDSANGKSDTTTVDTIAADTTASEVVTPQKDTFNTIRKSNRLRSKDVDENLGGYLFSDNDVKLSWPSALYGCKSIEPLQKALLKEAGLEKGFSIDLWAMPVQRPYNPNARRMAEMIQADWAKVGVQAKIVTYEWGEYLKRAKDGEHQTVMMGWTGDNGDPDNFFATLFSCAASEQGSNYSKWCYKPFEDLIQPARATDDHNKRVELYKQAQVVMHDQAPALIIAHFTVFEPVRKEVKGYVVDPLGKHHFENVSIE